jgi:hypothetical protein
VRILFDSIWGRLSFASSVGRLHREESNDDRLGRCGWAMLSPIGPMTGPHAREGKERLAGPGSASS